MPTSNPAATINSVNLSLSLAQGALSLSQGQQTPPALQGNPQVTQVMYTAAQQYAMLAATGQATLPAPGAVLALSTTPPGGLAALLPAPNLAVPPPDPTGHPTVALAESISVMQFVVPRLGATQPAPATSGIPLVDQILQTEASGDSQLETAADLQIIQVALTDLLAFACNPMAPAGDGTGSGTGSGSGTGGSGGTGNP